MKPCYFTVFKGHAISASQLAKAALAGVSSATYSAITFKYEVTE